MVAHVGAKGLRGCFLVWNMRGEAHDWSGRSDLRLHRLRERIAPDEGIIVSLSVGLADLGSHLSRFPGGSSR